VICGIDDPAVRALIPRVKRRVMTYGVAGDADVRAVEVKGQSRGCSFVVVREGRRLGEVSLGLPGLHNAVNALAALSVAFELDVDFDLAAKALDGFTGVSRRFEVKGEAGGVTVVDDYGHHPTEIKATLQAARELIEADDRAGEGRLIVAFQPHRYSRTRDLWEDFRNSFFDADVLLMTEIYEASEKPLPGITGAALCGEVEALREERGLSTRYVARVGDVAGALMGVVKPGDLVLTLGAGAIYRAGEELLERLEALQ